MDIRGQRLSHRERKREPFSIVCRALLSLLAFVGIAVAEQVPEEFAQCHDFEHLTNHTGDDQTDDEVMLTLPENPDDEMLFGYALQLMDNSDAGKKEALRLFESLTKSDDEDIRKNAIFYLSRLYRYDFPTKENHEKALSLYLTLALQGDDSYDAFMDVAEMYERGIGTEPDFESAGMWYWRANNVSAGGEPAFRLAELYRRNKIGSTWIEENYATFYYEVAQEKGAGNTVLSALAEQYLKGRGVAVEPQKAKELFELALNKNDFFAQVRHDILLAADSGTLKFQNWTFADAQSRADADDVDGLFLAGLFSAIGRKTNRDLFAAHHWLEQASSQGHAMAPYLLLYMRAHRLPRLPLDAPIYEKIFPLILDDTAYKLLLISADRGYWRAQHLLGIFVSTGEFGDLDLKCGTYWYEKGLLGEAETKGPEAVSKVKKRIASGKPYFRPRCTEEQIKNATTVTHWDGIGPFGTWTGGVIYDDCAAY